MLRAALVVLLLQSFLPIGQTGIQNAIAEDSGRNNGSGQRAKIRAGCGSVTDSTGRDVGVDEAGKPTAPRIAPCLGARASEPASVRPQRERPASAPAPVPDPIRIDEPPDDGPKNVTGLKVDPVGVGFALVSGGLLYGFLSSGWLASLLLLGLPIWRDLDLLPIVARPGDDEASDLGEASNIAEESVFSHEADENESDPLSPRAPV